MSSRLRNATSARHIRITILVIGRLLTNCRGFRSVWGAEISGRLTGRESVRLLSKLSIAVLGLTLPELAAWGAGDVAVVRGGTEGFLFLVVADEDQLDED